jgi:hypothetical protein
MMLAMMDGDDDEKTQTAGGRKQTWRETGKERQSVI